MLERDAENGAVVTLRVDVLWIDFQCPQPENELQGALASKYRLIRCQPDELLLYDQEAPGLIVMEAGSPGDLLPKLFQAMKQRFSRTPVILLSRSLSLELALWAIKVRVWDLVPTPLTPANRQELLGRLETLLLHLRHPEASRQAIVSRGPVAPPPASAHLSDKQGLARLRPALEIIRGQFNQPLPEPMLAESCSMSVHHFSRTFSKLMGTPLQEYIVNMRLEAAIKLLLTGTRPVSSIALDVGFKDASYFSRSFKKRYQLSPSEFRATRGRGGPDDHSRLLKLISS